MEVGFCLVSSESFRRARSEYETRCLLSLIFLSGQFSKVDTWTVRGREEHAVL